MNLQKLNPWNWFKHEEKAAQVPVSRETNSPVVGGQYFPSSYHPIFQLHQEIDRLFDAAFSNFGFPTRRLFDSEFFNNASNGTWLKPNVDIAGDDKKYEITLDLPGLTEKDISVEVRGDILVVRGEKQETVDERSDKKFYRVERRYGTFERTLSLPDDAVADDIRATLKDGVLRLEIPRRETAENQHVKRIPIQH
ncbi:Hsp20/alpha crystallin family protein [Saccharophagus sp. K07]|jgi:HSP20 family protein|uniref:Hsp20/alpha crystallin family protein n=1 Tax=Saccharophagus sp. K07 TaxID=2283636 RepID=UPI00165200FB|nr:Hsp20/alpha crystallin family protein [Saccharophagus sp. K07]MBC6907203.1 Hsp20/alpha crystallin family protein [Saccharophagus sp. K07]